MFCLVTVSGESEKSGPNHGSDKKLIKVQNFEVSLYVKGFGAAAVRESNHGCNEELC